MRVNSSGNVGIGTTSPNIAGVSASSFGRVVSIRTDTSTARAVLELSGTNGDTTLNRVVGQINFFNGSNALAIINTLNAVGGSANSGALTILTTDAGTTSERMRITSAGNVGIGTTSPATKLDVSGSIRASTGILFGTDTASANTLSDYEEGTFDFGISFDNASAGVTYSTRAGKYTKIGRQVTVTGYIVLTSKGTSTGTARITGLPFTVFDNNANYSGVSFGEFNNITFADVYRGFANTNTTVIVLAENTSAGVASVLTNADFANNSSIILTCTYFTS
jgi:hypothetical protein